MKRTIVKMTEQDNVAVVISDTAAGTILADQLTAREDIPQAHKVALCDFHPGDPVIRYGVTLGYANQALSKGAWINEQSFSSAHSLPLEQISYRPPQPVQLPCPPVDSFLGYRNETGFAGTRNVLGIVPTVQCVAAILNKAAAKIRQDLLPAYPFVDDVVILNHDYGCGVAIDATEAKIPIRTLRNIISHPNFGGQAMIVGLGCEKLTPSMMAGPDVAAEAIMLQDYPGFQAMIDVLVASAGKKLAILNRRRREWLPLRELIVGMQCGGSDAFSGITANPAAGLAADMLVAGGATVLFSEVSEVRDAAHLLAARAVDESVKDKLIEELHWYDQYLAAGGADRSANPSPGNKKGGLSNVIEKAMGTIAKSGRALIMEVLSPGEKPVRQGLIFAATPASDFVCGPMQLASGITVQVFMTGRGTPYGLAAAPVIKVCSRSESKDHWADIIDFSAGEIADGSKTVDEVGMQLFMDIIDVASGRKKTASEILELYNDFCIFNPAPIT